MNLFMESHRDQQSAMIFCFHNNKLIKLKTSNCTNCKPDLINYAIDQCYNIQGDINFKSFKTKEAF